MGSWPRSRLIAAVALALTLALGVIAVVVVLLVRGGPSTTATRAQPPAQPPPAQPPPAQPPPAQPPPAQPPPAQPAAPGQQLGASVNILFNSGAAFSSAEIDAQLQALRATGARIARSDALWELAEPSPPVGGVHHYSWRFDDLLAGALAAHGLKWLPIVDYTAPWARAVTGNGHPPPSSAADYAAFAAALAARYGPSGSFWRSHPELSATPVDTYEIWNEPDNPTFFSPQPDPARYAVLYAQARAAITAVDAGARVIVGGLTHPEAFMPELMAAMPGLRGHLDGVAIHPYAASADGVLVRVHQARLVLRALGLADVPLYVTEFGWTTSPPHALNWAPAAQRASDIARTFAELGHTDCGVAAVVLYTWVTLEQNPTDREDWYGIHPPGGADSGEAAALAAGLRSATAPGAEARTCSTG